MRCIFCKTNSDASLSVEHIIPESLGNTEHTLQPGWVCDGCNNYFARKIEKPFLESIYGRNSRFEMNVPNKRGRTPSALGFHAQSRTKVELSYSTADGFHIAVAEGEDESRWVASVQSDKTGTLYVPVSDSPPDSYVTSRFIAKVALEVLAHRCMDVLGWNDEIVDKAELDELRNYVRLGRPDFVWPVHVRRIYPQEQCFADVQYGSHQKLHEWDVLHTPEDEWYIVLAIFGVEYSINLGGPELEGYHIWLKHNHDQSPLYVRPDF